MKATDQLLETAQAVAAHAARLEAHAADLERQLVDERAERKVWQAAAEEAEHWTPKPCDCGCGRLVPNEAHTKLFAALGYAVPIGIEDAMAMRDGFATARCREGWIQEHSGNVLPFPAQQEGR